MATAIQLITRALRLSRVIGKDQTPDAEESNDALTMLNWMLDQWWIQSLAVYATQKTPVSWPSGAASRSIGLTGDTVSDRPVKVVPGSSLRYLGVDYPVSLLTNIEQYERITDKAVGGIPQYLFFDPQYPNGMLYLWPVPAQPMTLTLTTYQRIETIASLASQVEVPPAYEMAMIYNLGVMLAPEYGVGIQPDLQKQATQAKAIIEHNNARPLTMSFDPIASGYVRNMP